jgi:hypothetical protein
VARQDGLAEDWKGGLGMNLLGGLGSGTTFMTPMVFWALVVVTVIVGIGIGAFIAAGKAKAKAEALRALNQSLRAVPEACRVNGHVYKEYDTGWRCVTCGNFVPRREGELYGLVTDSRHERRRHPR